MMKLISRAAASGFACLPDFLVFSGMLGLLVKLHLNWAFYVFAEFSSGVLGEFA